MEGPVVEVRKSKYQFTTEMGEISGFGGGYEQTCRNMLSAALDWFDENPKAEPKFKGLQDVFGICLDDNPDAENLEKAIMEACFNDCTGAMHHAVIGAAFWIKRNGWDKYVEEMIKGKEENERFR